MIAFVVTAREDDVWRLSNTLRLRGKKKKLELKINASLDYKTQNGSAPALIFRR